MDAQKFIDQAEQLLPGAEMIAHLTGLKLAKSIVAVLRRATENPETKAQLIAWMRWTPMFTAAAGDAGTPEPLLPEAYADIREDALEFRVGCENCD